jgi:methionine synthase I (cobalamin-dependent)
MSDLLSRLLAEKPFLLADGATCTNLFAMGLQTGDAPELWNTEHPERIAAHYRSFVEAGSDIILTNSFGGNRHRLKLHGAEDRVAEINEAAARIARAVVAEAGRPVVVAGSMGPTGEILEPNGPLSIADASAAFAEQARALARGGVDVLWIETLSAREELDAALAGAAEAGLPVVCTMSFDTNGRTMMGLTPLELAQLAAAHPAHPQACGSNCGVGAAEVVAAIALMHRADGEAQRPVLVAKANCGIPEYRDGHIVYNGTPELMADYARLAHDAGARIIGGCCGTTPEHIRAMRAALDGYTGGPEPDAETIMQRLGEISTGARAQLRGDFSVAGGSASGRSTVRRGRRSRSG